MTGNFALNLPFFSIYSEDTLTKKLVKVREKPRSLHEIIERCLEHIFHSLCGGYDLAPKKNKKGGGERVNLSISYHKGKTWHCTSPRPVAIFCCDLQNND